MAGSSWPHPFFTSQVFLFRLLYKNKYLVIPPKNQELCKYCMYVSLKQIFKNHICRKGLNTKEHNPYTFIHILS